VFLRARFAAEIGRAWRSICGRLRGAFAAVFWPFAWRICGRFLAVFGHADVAGHADMADHAQAWRSVAHLRPFAAL